jgi:molybdopterin-guanine dinucleotide biosynthesis protein A
MIGVILAGGTSQRMGGHDKALVKLAGKSLFEHVLTRLAPQVDRVIISGASDYGSGLVALADLPGGAAGPVAGIRAAHDWLAEQGESDCAIVTAPVDCPFLPGDLVARLAAPGAAAIAEGDDHIQPAFGLWPQGVIAEHVAALEQPGWLSLKRWARLCDASEVEFGQTGAFLNINCPEDLVVAEQRFNG